MHAAKMTKQDSIPRQHSEASPPLTLDEVIVGEHTTNAEHTPPDGGYGWVCVAACFTINCFTWGTVSVSQGRLLEETFFPLCIILTTFRPMAFIYRTT